MPIYPGETCPMCAGNPNITHICENCRECFCDDCLEVKAVEKLICSQCSSTNILVNNHQEDYCGECGSSLIKTTRDLISFCPNCEGSEVVKIETKQNELIEHYKIIINSTRMFLEPIENTLDLVNKLKSSLLDLRTYTPPSFHFPNNESDILLLFKLFNNMKNTIYDQVNKFFQEIQRNIHYISEIPTTHPANLSYIGEILGLFENEHRKVKKFSKSTLKNLDSKINSLDDKIRFMERQCSIFSKFNGKYQLECDEKIVFAIECKLASGENDSDNFSRKKGTILITSKRIHFLHERGMFKKKNVLLFSVNLEDLQEVDVKGTLTKKVSLDFVNSMYEFKLSKENREILLEWIKNARNFETTNIIDEMKIKQVRKTKIDINHFRDELENAIYELIGFHGSSNKNSLDPYRNNQKVLHSNMYRNNKFNQNSNSMFSSQDQFGGVNVRSNPNPNIKAFNVDSNNPQFLNGFTSNAHFGYPHDHNTFKKPNQTPKSSHRNELGGSLNQEFSNANANANSSFDFNERMRKSGVGLNNNSRNFASNSKNHNNKNQFNQHLGSLGNNSRNGFGQKQTENSFTNREFKKPDFNNFNQKNSMDYGSPSFNENNFDQDFPKSSPDFSNSFGFGSNFRGNPEYSSMNQNPSHLRGQNEFYQKSNEEFYVKSEIQKLKQEEFALNETIRMLEERFDAGYMNNIDFFKSFREMQREKYTIQTKIEKLKKYLKDNYEIFHN